MMFVSYSRSDLEITQSVVESLMMAGIECWIDESNIPMGQAFVEQLGQILRKADCFLLIDTPASRSSYWVRRELMASFRYRRSGRYHSILRLYSPNCKNTESTNWDLSLPLDQQAPDEISKFLTARNINQRLPITDDQLGNFSILNNAGLGQPSNWNGRQEELLALDEWWFGSSPGVWLHGLGGSGKSGLIQTWITALSSFGYQEVISASVLYFAGSQIDLPVVQHEIRAWKSSKSTPSRLLILDGYDEAHNLQNIEKFLSDVIYLGARVLVTSRSSVPQEFANAFTTLSLANLTRRDSIAMMDQFGITGPESEELAAELGDHPLALLLLSRSFVSRDTTVSEVLKELRLVRGDISAHSFPTSSFIRATINSSLRGLTPDVRSLLESLCQNAEGAVDPSKLSRSVIRELANAGLVQVDHLETPTQISIHPIVRNSINENQGTIMVKR